MHCLFEVEAKLDVVDPGAFFGIFIEGDIATIFSCCVKLLDASNREGSIP